jgi:hypothetical protein
MNLANQPPYARRIASLVGNSKCPKALSDDIIHLLGEREILTATVKAIIQPIKIHPGTEPRSHDTVRCRLCEQKADTSDKLEHLVTCPFTALQNWYKKNQ